MRGFRHFRTARALVCAAAAAALAACTAQGIAERPGGSDAIARPLLQTSYGPMLGTREGNGSVMVFKGVRYAASTEGRRFQTALAPQPWNTPADASEYGNDCPQIPGGDVPLFASWSNDRPDSEDCLFLNVWTRGLNDGGKRPIMVWLHGGGYVTGSGSALGYDGTRLAQRGDVVIVTINHRLSAFGYLYLAELTDDPKYADSGNIGSLDIQRALEWVRDNAAAIGGDPDNVTIFGESGGAAKVSTMMAMEGARALFHKAIAQSGSMSLAGFTPRVGTAIATDLLHTGGMTPADIDRLATMPIEEFVPMMMRSRSRGAYFRPVVDGRSLTRQPFTPDAAPTSRDVPLLVGTNRTEMRLQAGLSGENWNLGWEQLPEKLKPFLGADVDPAPIIAGMRAAHPDADASEVFFQAATYRNYRGTAITQAERKSAQGGAPVWMYRLDWETPVDGGKWKTPHALDIGFVFDNVARSTSMTGSGPGQDRLAELMSEAWIAFARTGNPNTAALPDWPIYDARTRATMIFDVPPHVVNDPDGAERELLSQLPEGRGL
ncbi:carboxylesterase/lipase family protein [Sphingosinithalassobacter portus]|uniref:carboxylesterase/lipase family protein n=1 Tax=Stakelama portus TaxID=2676234 RepID=UPI000D6E3BE4|nr:carboxylesterase family protein [Sphingosinithalassobacter portus]